MKKKQKIPFNLDKVKNKQFLLFWVLWKTNWVLACNTSFEKMKNYYFFFDMDIINNLYAYSEHFAGFDTQNYCFRHKFDCFQDSIF
jgi:hypothetical protein